MCAKMIINAGVAEVVHDAAYAMDATAADLLRQAGVKIRPLRED
jgi:deoxycytidylate deaminase